MIKPIVVANWKMNPATFREAKRLFDVTKKAADKAKNVSLVVAPPALYLRDFAAGYRGKRISFAIQDVYYASSGAYTGGISLGQARDAGASHVIVGHSERRAAGETNEDTRKKVLAALAARMTPIFCVGEAERTTSGTHLNFIKEQLLAGFADVPAAQVARVIVAYEPIWAIGLETAMSPRNMQEMSILIRKTIVDSHGQGGHKIKIIYGGAITEKNAPAMMRDGDVHGLLVGHVSIDAKRFTALLKSL